MTYERFVKEVTTRDSKLTRKDISKFTRRFFTSFICLSLVLLYFCSCTLPNVVVPLIGVLLAILVLFLYDYMAESENFFNKAMKVSRHWWLHIVLAVMLYVLITYTCT